MNSHTLADLLLALEIRKLHHAVEEGGRVYSRWRWMLVDEMHGCSTNPYQFVVFSIKINEL